MLAQQQKIQLSSYSGLYDLIIPKDNLLRKISELIDFTFIYDELLDKYCSNNGRMAESPVRMFKYLLLKTIYTISDVDVVERSQYDMSFKYFLDMAPEDEVINPSSLTKFRKLRLKDADLLNLLISKTVSIAIEKDIIKSKSIIVDATHSLSRSNPHSALEVLRERSKLLRKAVYNIDEEMKGRMPKKNDSDDLERELAYCKELEKCIESDQTLSLIPAVKERLNLLKETVEDTQENYTLSKDKDAKTGHKSADSKFFGYKTHLAMTEERIIMAVRTFLPYTKKVRKPVRQEYSLFPQTVGEHIRKVRIERGLSQLDVAQMVGVSDESVYYWENSRSVPQVQFYPSIIAFLGYYPFEHDTQTIAGKLQHLINCNGWNHKACSIALGMDSGTVKRILSGKRTTAAKMIMVLQRWAQSPDHVKQQYRSR